MAPQDAMMYWLSARTRNDLFLLYCFADSGRPTTELRDFVARRSAQIPDLRVRLHAVPADLDYPSWIPADFAAEQFVEHHLPERNWNYLCSALGKLLGTGVDAALRPWRLHVFRGVTGVPGHAAEAPAVVVVLQVSHALADGRRGAQLARALFAAPDAGRSDAESSSKSTVVQAIPVVPELLRVVGEPLRPLVSAVAGSALGVLRMPLQVAGTAVRGYHAFRAQRELAARTAAGEIPGPGPSFMPSVLNRSIVIDAADHDVRMIPCPADELRLPDRTVTVVVLTAISVALSAYLAYRDEPIERLGAQVPMALPDSAADVRNNYRSLGVDLYLDEPDLRLRADRIADALTDRRTRARHPLLDAQDRVTMITPAAVLRRDVDSYPVDVVPETIAGHTVVSSVHRGPADLTFGGGRVLFTAGFPALGSVMHLTHGVHGLGSTVTISLHADRAAIPDLDTYAALLRSALRDVVAAHR